MNGNTGLRLLIFGINYAPWSTGIPKYSGEMGEWLAARGHDVEVIAAIPHYPGWKADPGRGGNRYFTERRRGVRILRTPVRLPRSSRVRTRDRILLEISYMLCALRYWLPVLADGNRYDAVICISPPTVTALYPALYGLLRGVPWLLHVQDLQVDAAMRLGMLRGKIIGRLLYAVERFLLRKAGAVSTISEPMCRRVIEKGVPPDRVRLLPNWADTQNVRPLDRDNLLRRSLGIGPEKVLVMCAGAMGEKHALDVVLASARILAGEPSIRFVLVGEGSARERLRKRAAELALENVAFLPLQRVDRLAELLSAADLHLVTQRSTAADFVMPSRLTNILAAGRPAIVTAAAGTALHGVIREAGAGMACTPDDAAALALAIRELAEDAGRRREMGVRARAYAERHLARDRILADLQQRLLEMRGWGRSGQGRLESARTGGD